MKSGPSGRNLLDEMLAHLSKHPKGSVSRAQLATAVRTTNQTVANYELKYGFSLRRKWFSDANPATRGTMVTPVDDNYLRDVEEFREFCEAHGLNFRRTMRVGMRLAARYKKQKRRRQHGQQQNHDPD